MRVIRVLSTSWFRNGRTLGSRDKTENTSSRLNFDRKKTGKLVSESTSIHDLEYKTKRASRA